MSDLPPPPGTPPPPGGGGFPPPPPPPPGGPPPPDAWSQAAAGPVAQYANFGQRLVAMIIDALVLGIPGWIISTMTVNSVPTEIVSCDDGLCEQPTGAGFGVIALMSLVQIGLACWYWAELEGRRGQSLGKKAVSIRTIDMNTGHHIGAGRGVGRYFARILSTVVCLLGYFWMLWDDRNQTWHDKIVSSVVVKA